MKLFPLDSGPFQLASGMVHCWCINVEVSDETCARLQASLSFDELGRCARFPSERDRRRFIGAHGLMREILACYLRIEPRLLRYEYNPNGKPRFGPELGNRINFNISHSAGLALLAVTTGRDVGVDLEHVRTVPQDVEIGKGYFSAAEVDHLKQLRGSSRNEAFFRYWTRTEAYVKACGEGLAAFEGAPIDVDRSGRWSSYSLRPAPGYIGALVIEGSCRRLTQRRWMVTP